MPYQIIQSWYINRWWVGCHIWYSEEGPGWAGAPPSPLLAVPNVTAHPLTASVPITVLLYNGPLLCDFNVGIKGLNAGSPSCVFNFILVYFVTRKYYLDVRLCGCNSSSCGCEQMSNETRSSCAPPKLAYRAYRVWKGKFSSVSIT